MCFRCVDIYRQIGGVHRASGFLAHFINEAASFAQIFVLLDERLCFQEEDVSIAEEREVQRRCTPRPTLHHTRIVVVNAILLARIFAIYIVCAAPFSGVEFAAEGETDTANSEVQTRVKVAAVVLRYMLSWSTIGI